MRFKLILERSGGQRFIPMNYQYELSAAIYKVIQTADADFSRFLHDQGYIEQGKQFRFFNFSNLFLDKQRTHPDQARLEHTGTQAFLQISFLVDRIAEEFVKGLFMGAQFFVGDRISGVLYQVVKIESVAAPVFLPVMKYRCLSPILIKEKRTDGGENYLAPTDENYSLLLKNNLCSKLAAYAMTLDTLEWSPDQSLGFELKVCGKVYKKGVMIKQMTSRASKLIGYAFEFELTAPPELQEIGYYAGFGNLNSQGFGCVEICKTKGIGAID